MGTWLSFKAADALLPLSGSYSKAVDTGRKGVCGVGVSRWGVLKET